MPPQAALGISVAFSFLAWGVVTARYVWPALRRRARGDALRPLLLFHAFRFVGLAFIVPGVVSPELPAGFARPAAYGDLVAAVLALLALASLNGRLGTVLVWLFSVWGIADLLNAFYQGFAHGMQAGQLGAAYFLLTIVVPLLFVTHILIVRLLVVREPSAELVQAPAG